MSEFGTPFLEIRLLSANLSTNKVPQINMGDQKLDLSYFENKNFHTLSFVARLWIPISQNYASADVTIN